MKTPYKFLIRTLLMVLAISSVFIARSQVIETFTPVYQNTQKGGIVFLSNVALTCASPDTNAVAPDFGTSNNALPSIYVDRDNDASTFMSTSDSLALPACSEISFVGIYWGGYATNATTGWATRDQIKIKANNGSYIDITAETSSTYNGSSFKTYHCYKDITDIAKTYGINARWTVADVIGQTGQNNRFAGWNIVVVYKNDLQNMRQLTVFNGLANVQSVPVDIPVVGFLTPPTGPVTFEMGIFCYDGDRPTPGDELLFNGAGSFVNLSNSLQYANNVFNSTISNLGVMTPYRKPFYNNNFSIDADIFAPDNTAKNYIGNNATSCTLRQTTSGDVYLTQTVTFAIDVYSPDDRAAVRVQDLNGGSVMPGDILEYTIVGKNIGSDPSLNTFITDSLEGNIDYVPNSLSITYGPNSGVKTDASGDDQFEYDAVNHKIVVRIGTGANSSTGGQVNNSTFGNDSTQLKFRVQVTNDCYKLACDNVVNNSAVITGTGITSGLTYTNASNPDIFDGFGCPIPGSTNTVINTGLCVMPADTSMSACSHLTFAALYPYPGYVFYNSSWAVVAAPSGTGTYYALHTSYAGCVDTVQITVTAYLNCNAPVTFNETISLNEDANYSGNVLANGDNDPDGTALSVVTTPVSGPAHGTVVVAANGAFTYTPAANYNGPDQFIVSVCDAGLPAPICTNDTVFITVNPLNDTPVAGNDPATTNEDTPVTFNILTNDSDIDGPMDPASIDLDPATPGIQTSFTVAGQGTYVVNPVNGDVTFTPVANFNGVATPVTYQVCDLGTPLPALCAQANITVTVTAVNDAPVANDDSQTTAEDTPITWNIITNDTDLDGAIDPATIDLDVTTPGVQNSYTIPGQGTYSVNPANGNLTFTPVAGYSGVVNPVTYNVCDNGTPLPAQCDQAVITMSVGAVNDPPVVTGKTVAGTEDTPVTICMTITDPDAGSNFTASACGGPSNGTIGTPVVSGGQVCVTYTPNANYNGTDVFCIQICDDGSPMLCDTAMVTVVVAPVNDVPVANDDPQTTAEDTPVTWNIIANDTDLDGAIDPATIDLDVTTPGIQTTLVVPNQGTYTVNPATGDLTFTPVPDFNGTATPVTYNVCDNGTPLPAQCDQAVISITVTPVNDGPVALNDINATFQNMPVSGSLLINDSDPEGDPLTINTTPVVNPVNGVVTINPDGTYTYTPNAGFTGTDTFQYEVCDNGTPPQCDIATVTINIIPLTPGNDAPLANNDAYQGTVNTPVIGTVASNDYDPDGNIDPTSYTLVSPPPANGTLTFNPDGTFTFVPNPGFAGQVTFDYQVCDLNIPPACDIATVTIDIYGNPTNANMTFATDDSYFVNEDVPYSSNVLNNDYDPQGNTMTVDTVAVTTPLHGTLDLNADGTFTYTPDPNFSGHDQFSYNVCDNGTPQSCDIATVYLIIAPVNDPPVAVDDINTTFVDMPVSGNLLTNDNDPEGDPLIINQTPAINPVNGTVVINADGTYTYTPNAGFTGIDTFEYIVCDGGSPSQCDTAVVTINILPLTPGNDPPIANNDAYQGSVNLPVNGSVGANDYDPDGNLNPQSYVLVGPAPATGTLTFNANGTFTYIPTPGFIGQVSFDYQVCDSLLLCDQATVTLDIQNNPTGNSTFAADDYGFGNEDGLISGNVLGNDYDPQANTQTVDTIAVSGPLHGTLDLNADGTYTYTPDPNYNGADQFVYTVCDNGTPQACDQATVYLTVAPVNDPPVTMIDYDTIMEGGVSTINILANDTDLDGTLDPATIDLDPATAGVQTTYVVAGQGTYTVDPLTGIVTFTPLVDFSGSATPILYTVCDNGTPLPAQCAQDTISIMVTPVNDPPVVTGTTQTTTEDTPITICLPITDPDAGATFTASLCGSPANGTLSTPVVTGNQVCVTYTPNAEYSGTDQFCIQICDEAMACDTAIITVNVTPVNDAPVAVDDYDTIQEGTQALGNVLTNDTDIDGGALTVTTFTINGITYLAGTLAVIPGVGTMIINPNGSYIFTPDPLYNGSVPAVGYTVSDGNGGTATATLYITIIPVNNAPVIVNENLSACNNQPLTGNVLANGDTDPDGTALSVTALVNPAHGTFSVQSNGDFTYTPAAGYSGTDRAIVSVCDNGTPLPAACTNDTINITVVAAVLVNASADTTLCGAIGSYTLAGASVQNSGSLLWSTSGTGTFADATIANAVYSPSAADITAGSVILTLTATGNTPCGDVTDQVTITFAAAPTANAGGDKTICNSTIYQINDATATGLSAILWTMSPATAGSLSGATTITPTYTPNDTFTGDVTLTLTVTGNPACGVITDTDDVVITVASGVTANAGADQLVLEGTTTTLDGNATGGSGNYSWSWQPVSMLVDNHIHNPVTNAITAETVFTLTVLDNVTLCSATDQVVIFMDESNNPPVAVDDNTTTEMGQEVEINILTNDSDPDGDPLTYTLCGNPAHGTVVLGENSISYTPNYNTTEKFFGDDSFCYVICDNGNPALCDTAIVTIHVKAKLDELEIFNLITPNGDNNNDVWYIRGIEDYPDNTVLIFNRWGDKVADYSGYNNTTNSWNGRNEDDEVLPSGTYFYILTIKNVGSRTGWIFQQNDEK